MLQNQKAEAPEERDGELGRESTALSSSGTQPCTRGFQGMKENKTFKGTKILSEILFTNRIIPAASSNRVVLPSGATQYTLGIF